MRNDLHKIRKEHEHNHVLEMLIKLQYVDSSVYVTIGYKLFAGYVSYCYTPSKQRSAREQTAFPVSLKFELQTSHFIQNSSGLTYPLARSLIVYHCPRSAFCRGCLHNPGSEVTHIVRYFFNVRKNYQAPEYALQPARTHVQVVCLGMG